MKLGYIYNPKADIHEADLARTRKYSYHSGIYYRCAHTETKSSSNLNFKINCLVLTVYIHCSYTRVLQKKDLDGKFQYYTKNSKENGYIRQVKTKW